MTEEQADRMIELLEMIYSKLEEVQTDTGWISHHTSNIETNTNT